MKKLISILLAAVLTLAITAPALAAGVTAIPTLSKVMVNNAEKSFDAYNIDGNNYFKLRDIAYVLSGTAKQFEVTWDADKNAISLERGKPYTPDGSEMSAKSAGNKTAAKTSSRLYLDGAELSLDAYNIGGSNYFKLRDLSKSIDLFVGWDGFTIFLDSSKGYDHQNEGVNVTPPAAPPVLNSLPVPQSLKKGMTDSEFDEAYDTAYAIASQYAGLSRAEQLQAIFAELRYLTERELTYSTTEKHYNDVYGFFVLDIASCAGATRAVALCLTILGIPYEHVNENQWTHQWCRVEVDGTYWICDAYGYYVGPEPAPYEHPWF